MQIHWQSNDDFSSNSSDKESSDESDKESFDGSKEKASQEKYIKAKYHNSIVFRKLTIWILIKN